MIHIYTGKTGSGKTFQMINDIYPQWLNGRDVYANTKLFFEKYGGKAGTNIIENPENFTIIEKAVEIIRRNWLIHVRKKLLGYFIRRGWVNDYDYYPKSRGRIDYFDDITELIEIRDGIICMDEAQNLLDSRQWENLPTIFSNKLRQHRKHNLDLYATTQNMGTIDLNLRRLVQRWKHSKDVFALFGLRNPSWFTVHTTEEKDIDMLYTSVDDLVVPSISTQTFFIHLFKRRLYDTLYDIGFNNYKILWLQENKKKIILFLPKEWTLSNARTQSLLLKFYLDLPKLKTLKKD